MLGLDGFFIFIGELAANVRVIFKDDALFQSSAVRINIKEWKAPPHTNSRLAFIFCLIPGLSYLHIIPQDQAKFGSLIIAQSEYSLTYIWQKIFKEVKSIVC